MLWKIFGSKTDEITGEWERLHNEELFNCTPHQINSGDLIKENEMGRPCGMYGGLKKCIQGFDGET